MKKTIGCIIPFITLVNSLLFAEIPKEARETINELKAECPYFIDDYTKITDIKIINDNIIEYIGVIFSIDACDRIYVLEKNGIEVKNILKPKILSFYVQDKSMCELYINHDIIIRHTYYDYAGKYMFSFDITSSDIKTKLFSDTCNDWKTSKNK